MTRKAKLEKALAPSLPNDTIRLSDMAWGIQCHGHAQRLEPLRVALIEAVEALEFYASIENWSEDNQDEPVYNDCGDIAREALAKIDEELQHA